MGGPADDKPRAPRAGTPPRAPTPTAHDPGAKKAPSIRPGGAKALIGLTISDRYKIERLLGEGGMGAVYQAEHTLMRKRMAIKVLHPEMTRLPEVVARFEREAMAAAHIDHPNVVTATDFGKLEDGSFFLALEFVEGKSLREVIAQGRLELGRALHIGRQMAAALQRAHGLKIVHRDLKPENVMLVDRDGDPDFAKVLDFGIAKVQIGELGTNERPGGTHDPGQPVLTQAGMVYGTPEYMAPEQALGQPVDARADLYALGIILYEMLCGVRPFEAESKVALLGMQVTAPVPPMAQKCPEANVPPEVEALIGRLLAKEASERIGDAREVIEGISNILVSLSQSGRIDARFAPPPTSGMMTNPGLISGFGPAPAELVAASPPAPAAKSEAPGVAGLLSGRGWIIAMAAGLLGLVLMVTTIVYVLKGREGPTTDADGGTVTTTVADGATVTTTSDGSLDDKVKEGIAMIQRGDYGSGIEKLEGLGDAVQGREDVHRALLKAYQAKKAPKETMREAGLLLKANPNLVQTKKDEVELRVAIRDVTLSEGTKDAEMKAAVEEAWSLQQNALSTVGWDDLYDTAYGGGAAYPEASKRAKAIIAKGERAKMGPALQVLLDLQAAGVSCAAKAHFERAGQVGDDRVLAHLKKLSTAHQIVGRGRRAKDELACLHDGQLARAMAAIEERLKSEKK